MNLPKAEMIAKHSGVNVTKAIITDRSPDSIVHDFQASFVCFTTSCHSH